MHIIPSKGFITDRYCCPIFSEQELWKELQEKRAELQECQREIKELQRQLQAVNAQVALQLLGASEELNGAAGLARPVHLTLVVGPHTASDLSPSTQGGLPQAGLSEQLSRSQAWAFELYSEVQRLTAELQALQHRQQHQLPSSGLPRLGEGQSMEISGSAPKLPEQQQLLVQISDLEAQLSRAEAWAAELHQAVQEGEQQLRIGQAREQELEAQGAKAELQAQQLHALGAHVALLQDKVEAQHAELVGASCRAPPPPAIHFTLVVQEAAAATTATSEQLRQQEELTAQLRSELQRVQALHERQVEELGRVQALHAGQVEGLQVQLQRARASQLLAQDEGWQAGLHPPVAAGPHEHQLRSAQAWIAELDGQVQRLTAESLGAAEQLGGAASEPSGEMRLAQLHAKVLHAQAELQRAKVWAAQLQGEQQVGVHPAARSPVLGPSQISDLDPRILSPGSETVSVS